MGVAFFAGSWPPMREPTVADRVAAGLRQERPLGPGAIARPWWWTHFAVFERYCPFAPARFARFGDGVGVRLRGHTVAFGAFRRTPRARAGI